MSTWRLRESRELGKETRLLELRREGLSVGRSSDCDVQLLVGGGGGVGEGVGGGMEEGSGGRGEGERWKEEAREEGTKV